MFHQCSTNGITQAVVCAILSMVHIKDPLLLIEKSSSGEHETRHKHGYLYPELNTVQVLRLTSNPVISVITAQGKKWFT